MQIANLQILNDAITQATNYDTTAFGYNLNQVNNFEESSKNNNHIVHSQYNNTGRGEAIDLGYIKTDY